MRMRLILIMAFFVIMAGILTVKVYGFEKNELHIIAFAQEPQTEIEIKIDGKRHTEMLDAGVTYLSYKAAEPEMTVWEYGEKTKPRVDKGRDGEWYSIVMVQVPEGVGE